MPQPKDKDWLNGFKKKKKQFPYICCLQETHLETEHIQTESEGLEKDIPHK